MRERVMFCFCFCCNVSASSSAAAVLQGVDESFLSVVRFEGSDNRE